MFTNKPGSTSLLIAVFCGVVCIVVRADDCTTPNGDTGKCISIYNCTILLEAIQTQSQGAIEFAKKSQCGYDNSPLVCCGNASNFTKLLTNLLPPRSYCGFQHSDDYFSNRKNNFTSAIDEFPWLAALIYQALDTEQILCVGTLINDRYVLTTAHCLRKPQGATVVKRVRLGEYNIELQDDCVTDGDSTPECSEPTADFGVEEIIVHKLFNLKRQEYDIGLIRLNRTVVYSDYIRPICLPLPDTPRAKVGDILAETGWGRTTRQGDVTKVKKKVSTEVISREACTKAYQKRYNYTINDGQICTKDVLLNSVATCQGDSGGPVMFPHNNQWSQEGIVSFGGPCGSGFPDVHVKVANYVNWILTNIRK